jgi:hypothetical protein
MPNVLFIRGFRFFFYSNESNEPPHIHVSKGGADGKLWLLPIVAVAYLYGFTNSEEKDIIEIATANSELFKSKWNEYFSK